MRARSVALVVRQEHGERVTTGRREWLRGEQVPANNARDGSRAERGDLGQTTNDVVTGRMAEGADMSNMIVQSGDFAQLSSRDRLGS